MRISICIPHYNRARHLLAVLESIRAQDYKDIEVVVSDDCSKDDSASLIPAYISALALDNVQMRYIRQEKNIGYDANLRAALGFATGEYLFILGNDDALPTPETLSDVARVLERLGKPAIAFGNYHAYGKPEAVMRRALSTKVVGAGPDVAARAYRSFGFVAGIIFSRDAFQAHNTDQYDGSIYVQIYLAARIIAAGGTLATLGFSIVSKDVLFEGEKANSYLEVLRQDNEHFIPRTGGLDQVGRVACEAILPYVQPVDQADYLVSIYQQLLSCSYANWLYQYRRDGVYRASVNLALGCYPSRLLLGRRARWWDILRIFAVYVPVTLAGLFAPLTLIEAIKEGLYRRSKIIGTAARSGIQ